MIRDGMFHFTMPGDGFRSLFHCKAILVTGTYDEAGNVVIISVLDMPLTALARLRRQSVFYFERSEVPDRLLMAIDDFYENYLKTCMDKVQKIHEADLAKIMETRKPFVVN